MFMSDVKDILGVKPSDKSGTPKAKPKKTPGEKSSGKRHRSAADCVKNLLQPSMGINPQDILSHVPEPQMNHLEASKKKFGKKPVRKWVLQEFGNSARADDLKLTHWTRAGTTPGEYPFAVLDKQEPLPKYTDAQYEVLLKSNDWTKEETDAMIATAGKYFLQWDVIADRFIFNGKTRTIDEIKARFFDIEDTMASLNDDRGPMNAFNFEEEVERKRRFRLYFEKSQEDIDEDEKAMKEVEKLRKIVKEMDAQKRKDMAAEILKTFGHSEASAVAAAQITKRKSMATPKANSSTPLSNTASSSTPVPSSSEKLNEVLAFALSSRPLRKAQPIKGAHFSSEIIESTMTAHLNKQPLIYSVVKHYYDNHPLSQQPNIFSNMYSQKIADKAVDFRSRIHQISELKGSLICMTSEYAKLCQKMKAAGQQPSGLPKTSTIAYFNQPRTTGPKKSRESLFSIIPPTFPIHDCTRLNSNGEPVRKPNASTIVYPKELCRTRRSSTGFIKEQKRLSPTPSHSKPKTAKSTPSVASPSATTAVSPTPATPTTVGIRPRRSSARLSTTTGPPTGHPNEASTSPQVSPVVPMEVDPSPLGNRRRSTRLSHV